MRPTESNWGGDVEGILESMRQNSAILAKEHKNAYFRLNIKLGYYKLPIIIISALNSVISVSVQPYLQQSYISMITCSLSLITGIIGSVELYFGVQRQMEVELVASRSFYILSTDIFKVLNLDVERRGVDGVQYLTDKYSEYTKLVETSGMITKKLQDNLSPIIKNSPKSSYSSSSLPKMGYSPSSSDNGSPEASI